MKWINRLAVAFGVLLLPALIWSADLTAPVNTANGQLYNKSYRDIKDGSNAETVDCIPVNVTSGTIGSQNLIKGSAGYLGSIVFNGACFGTFSIADSATSAINYATTISTITSLGTAFGPVSLFWNSRFNSGLAINTPASTCTVSVSYR